MCIRDRCVCVCSTSAHFVCKLFYIFYSNDSVRLVVAFQNSIYQSVPHLSLIAYIYQHTSRPFFCGSNKCPARCIRWAINMSEETIDYSSLSDSAVYQINRCGDIFRASRSRYKRFGRIRQTFCTVPIHVHAYSLLIFGFDVTATRCTVNMSTEMLLDAEHRALRCSSSCPDTELDHRVVFICMQMNTTRPYSPAWESF